MKLIPSTLACLLTLSAFALPSACAAEADSASFTQKAKISPSPTPTSADTAPKPQIIIEAKMIETNAGKQDVMSAPRITTIDGNKAAIAVSRDYTISLPGGGKEARQTVQTGLNIEVTPFIQGDQILLRCNVTSTELTGEPTETPTSAGLFTRSQSIALVLLVEPGKSSTVALGDGFVSKDERSLSVELTASVAKPEANAAPLYWQAFAAMPNLSKEESALLALKTGDPLDKAAAEKLIAKHEQSLALLATASAIPECDWGLNLAEGPYLTISYAPKATELAKAARLRARLRLLEGNPGAAASDLSASLRLAKAAGKPGLLINLLVQLSIEREAIQMVAAHFGKFDTASLQQLAAVSGKHDRMPSVKHAIKMEKECFAGWFRHQVALARTKNESLDQAPWIDQFMDAMANPGAKSTNPLREEAIKALGGDWDGFEKQLSALEKDYDELARILGLPHAEIEPALAQFNAKVQENRSTNLLSSLALPSVDSCYNKETRLVAELSMMNTSIQMQLKGSSRLLESKDPFGSGSPFELKETAGGFELKSKLMINNKPVSLFFKG